MATRRNARQATGKTGRLTGSDTTLIKSQQTGERQR
jgi:hypothetical protein